MSRGTGQIPTQTGGDYLSRFFVCLVLTAPVLYWSPTIQTWAGYSAPVFGGSELIVPILATAILVWGGLPILRSALEEIRSRQPGTASLTTLALAVSFVFGMVVAARQVASDDIFWDFALLVDIVLLGLWIETRSVGVITRSLDHLGELIPETAEVVQEDGRVQDRYLGEVTVGDTVVVKRGATAPVDGLVAHGSTEMDEVALTGERPAVIKEPGDYVMAGTVNDGREDIEVEVAATGEETTLAWVRRLVSTAGDSPSSARDRNDRRAAALFYVAVAIAATAMVVWAAVRGELDRAVVSRVVAVLVVATPRALGMAVPLGRAQATSVAARSGILVRTPGALDMAREIHTVVFDKTGVLTGGNARVTGLATLPGTSKTEALRLAAAVESGSRHPIARAILRETATEAASPVALDRFEVIRGLGVRAVADEATVHVGGTALMRKLGLHVPGDLREFTTMSGRKGESVVYLVSDDEAVAAFAVVDPLRPASRRAIDALHDLGIEVAMVTGDGAEVARVAAHTLGVSKSLPVAFPEDKVQFVEDLRSDDGLVAMVGDGKAEARALASADIGIATGVGIDVADQIADLILLRSDPIDVVRVVRLSEAAHRAHLQNTRWAIGYQVAAIPIAAGILWPWGFAVPPTIAAALAAIATLVVAIRARRIEGEVSEQPSSSEEPA